MIRHLKFGLLAVGMLAIPIVVSAQTSTMPAHSAWHPMRIAHPQPSRAAAATHPLLVRVPARSEHSVQALALPTNASSNVSISSSGTVAFIPSGATTFDLNQLLNNVPGLGFDYSHVAALNQNFGERAFIDPVTQQNIALAEQLSQTTPGFTGGFIPIWGGFGYSEPVVEEQEPQSQAQPRVIILQEPPAATAPATNAHSTSESATPSEQVPLPDIGEFTLVLHNGKKIKAVAFSRQNNQIVYITSEGVRNSFPVSDLDPAATEQLNQQHGTPLHLSL